MRLGLNTRTSYTGLGLILLNTGIELSNQTAGISLQKYEDFLELTVFYLLILC